MTKGLKIPAFIYHLNCHAGIFDDGGFGDIVGVWRARLHFPDGILANKKLRLRFNHWKGLSLFVKLCAPQHSPQLGICDIDVKQKILSIYEAIW